MKSYRAFHKHANSKVQKPASQLHFSLPSIIITITSNEPWKHWKRIEIHQSQITNHYLLNLFKWIKLFPKRSIKMIDGTEKRKRQLAFELQSSRVFEKRCKANSVSFFLSTIWWLDALKSKDKIIHENAFRFFLGLKINPGLALMGLRTTRPRT